MGAKLKFMVIGIVLGAVLAVSGMLFIQSNTFKNTNGETIIASVVFDRIVSMNELVTVQQKYSITDKVTNTSKLFDKFDIPFTTNSFWYRYEDLIKTGVNMEKADFQTSGKTVTVSLEQPYIISNTPDMETTGVLEENNNIFNQIHVKDVDQMQRQCIEVSQVKAIEGGLLDEAKTSAEDDITNMLVAALGDDCRVQYTWKETEA